MSTIFGCQLLLENFLGIETMSCTSRKWPPWKVILILVALVVTTIRHLYMSHWLVELSSLSLKPLNYFRNLVKYLLWQWTGKWMKWPGHFTLSGGSFQRMKFHKHWLATIWPWSGNFDEMTGRWKSGDTMRHGVFWRCLASIIFKRCWFKLASIAINFGWIIIGTKN